MIASSGGGMTPEAFEGALLAIVPREVEPFLGAVYLDAATQLHEAMVLPTPVDTGYLRAGATATVAGESPPTMPPRNANALYDTRTHDADAFAAMARAASTLTVLVMGFTAEYAPYVEDWAHMVANARAQWEAIVARAVDNQLRRERAA